LASADEFDDPDSQPQTSQRKFVRLSRASKTTGAGTMMRHEGGSDDIASDAIIIGLLDIMLIIGV
jgi:hypothetical protein